MMIFNLHHTFVLVPTGIESIKAQLAGRRYRNHGAEITHFSLRVRLMSAQKGHGASRALHRLVLVRYIRVVAATAGPVSGTCRGFQCRFVPVSPPSPSAAAQPNRQMLPVQPVSAVLPGSGRIGSRLPSRPDGLGLYYILHPAEPFAVRVSLIGVF